MSKRLYPEVILQLLKEAKLSPLEFELRLRQALEPDYWRRLNPALSIQGNSVSDEIEVKPLGSIELSGLSSKLAEEGYFRAESVLAPSEIVRIRNAIESLRDERWPAVFAFVYDQLWSIFRVPPLHRLLTEFLGLGYRQNSKLWTHYVAQQPGAHGWPPHVDSGEPSRLTVWIPLTDATDENGCIYLVPANRVPDSLSSDFTEWSGVSKEELRRLLPAVKALPAKAGSLLGWTHQVIHWGSMSDGVTSPRISVACEFLGLEAKPYSSESPLWDLSPLPTFPERLRMIGRAILDYERFEPLVRRYSELANRLLQPGSPVTHSLAGFE